MSELLKKQNYGVEVEFTGISRKMAADAVAEIIGTTASRPDHTCYQTRTIQDSQGRKWKVMRDSSINPIRKVGTENMDEYRVEFVTPVLKYEDLDTLQAIIRNSLWFLIAKEGGCLTHTSCFAESQQINVSSFDSSLKQLKCFTSTQYHSNFAPIIIKMRRHFFVISSMQGKIASSSINCTVSCFMSISPRLARLTISCATHKLSFPPLKEKNTGSPFPNTFFIRISAAFTTSILASQRFTAISFHRSSGR